ncbi:MAG TPA: SUMF1/EgtB/PvdO family nonheme iron enzyme [Chloroflexia bacterium]|nr:SUMF1/EgtB/PvdO family nonheme iron enzyme [Chloroflexia bacterium]
MNTRIFLSHSSHDTEAVRHLAEDLKRVGLQVWLDDWEIRVGDIIPQKVQEGLDASDYLAVWMTRDAMESGWVEREWQTRLYDEANNRSKIVLPLLAEDIQLPGFLRPKRYADFRRDYGQGLLDLLRVVGLQSWENNFGIKFALIMPGAFLMGSDEGEENERPVHQVTITRPYYMAIYAVTQGQWKEIMHSEPWKEKGYVKEHVQEGDDYPAVYVSWYDAQDFLTKLSEIDNQNIYNLPTEEEWEYAARAGTNTKFSFGDDERDLRWYGWYRDMTQRGEEYAHPVGKKKPNPWGLYDMHGNVWEWMDNWYYGSYAARPNLYPNEKVLRGGGWDYPAYGARSAFRNSELPSRSGNPMGFRLVYRPSV